MSQIGILDCVVCVCSQFWLSLYDPMDCSPPGYSVHGIIQTTGVGCHFLLQGIFPTQGSNLSLLHLLHWQVDSLPLSHLKSRHLFLVWLPWWLSDKESACNARDMGSILGSGRYPEEENDNPLQYSCLENGMDRGAWRATAHGVTKESDMTKQ